jgi:hypothetical protein
MAVPSIVERPRISNPIRSIRPLRASGLLLAGWILPSSWHPTIPSASVSQPAGRSPPSVGPLSNSIPAADELRTSCGARAGPPTPQSSVPSTRSFVSRFSGSTSASTSHQRSSTSTCQHQRQHVNISVPSTRSFVSRLSVSTSPALLYRGGNSQRAWSSARSRNSSVRSRNSSARSRNSSARSRNSSAWSRNSCARTQGAKLCRSCLGSPRSCSGPTRPAEEASLAGTPVPAPGPAVAASPSPTFSVSQRAVVLGKRCGRQTGRRRNPLLSTLESLS